MTKTDASAARLMRWATYASVTVAGLLIASKFMAWLLTDSVSLLSTLIDSMIDAAASLINLIAVKHALEPADEEHRFGHGKAEALAGLAQSAFIVGSAMFLLIEAGQRIFNPKSLTHTEIGYGVMAFSIVLTLALIIFQRYVVRQTGSVAIRADSVHYQTDILTNISVIVSLFLVSYFGFEWADPLVAIGIAFFILYSAWQIATEVLQILMDRELPDEDRKRIRDIALAEEGVLGVHDLRTRSSGIQTFIQLHLQISGEMKLVDAHQIADAVELKISAAFKNAEVIAHQDPD
jgi:ferrous-iron efflux pump FieF